MNTLLYELWLLIVCQLLISTSQALNETNITTIEEEIIRRGYIPHPDVGFAYKVYTKNVSWTEASELCKSEGAKLAVIDTKKKLEYARIPFLDCDQLRHVGIHWVDEDWVNVSNESISYASVPWSTGEPGPRDNGFDCVMVGWKRLNFTGLMNGRCDKFVGEHICEIPIPNDFTVIETTTESSKEIITPKQKLLEDVNKRVKSVEDRLLKTKQRVLSESANFSRSNNDHSTDCEISYSNNVNENTTELEGIYKLLDSIEKQFIDHEKLRSSNSSDSDNYPCSANPESSCPVAGTTTNLFTTDSTTETTETIFTKNISTRKETTTPSNPHGV